MQFLCTQSVTRSWLINVWSVLDWLENFTSLSLNYSDFSWKLVLNRQIKVIVCSVATLLSPFYTIIIAYDEKSRWTPLKLNYKVPSYIFWFLFPCLSFCVLHLFSAASSPSFFPFLNSLLIHTRHHVHYIVIIFVIKVLTPFLHTKSWKLNTTHAAALVLSDRKIHTPIHHHHSFTSSSLFSVTQKKRRNIYSKLESNKVYNLCR